MALTYHNFDGYGTELIMIFKLIHSSAGPDSTGLSYSGKTVSVTLASYLTAILNTAVTSESSSDTSQGAGGVEGDKKCLRESYH